MSKLIEAVQANDIKMVSKLIKAGANVRADNDFALRWASSFGHVEVVKLLLKAGANVRADDDYALRYASNNGHVEVVKLLLEAGADVHARDDEALRWASENGYAEVVKLLDVYQNPVKNQALRYNDNKLPIHLVPPSAIEALAEVLKFGATKYSERNWEKGANYSVPYASMMRHMLKWWSGEDNDSESGLPHIYHALMNLAMLVEYSKNSEKFDDRPKQG